MKFRMTAAFMAALCLASAVSCTKKQDYSTSGVSGTEESKPQFYIPDTTEAPTEVVAAEDGPKISIDNVTAAPGEYATITLSVKDADLNWQMCGIHITYPNVLEPEMLNVEDRSVRFKRGVASEYSSAAVCLAWLENMPEELTSNNLGCFFFTEVFKGNTGQDGDIASFKLKIPDDAKSGTVYPIGFYYMDSDAFCNEEKDLPLQKYAFENMTPGSITVK